MSPKPDQDRSGNDEDPVRDALSAFNAEDVVDDPDGLDPKPDQPPAATPDSPNPI
jgi:hypothetical protein